MDWVPDMGFAASVVRDGLALPNPRKAEVMRPFHVGLMLTWIETGSHGQVGASRMSHWHPNEEHALITRACTGK